MLNKMKRDRIYTISFCISPKNCFELYKTNILYKYYEINF